MDNNPEMFTLALDEPDDADEGLEPAGALEFVEVVDCA